jgi:protein-L-isoaspartate(D-aspartate) O-methyltransferase
MCEFAAGKNRRQGFKVSSFKVSKFSGLQWNLEALAKQRMNSFVEAVAFTALRQRMVELQLRARGLADERVLQAMLRVPRHEFVSASYANEAYEDHPIPIGEGQTISQPYIVALMLEALQLTATDKVLEVGTGSGYVTGLLAELTAQVFSIERHSSLALEAQQLLTRLGCTNVEILVGDGSVGWPAHAPYDAIIVSAAAAELPVALLAQLREGGRMIIPVGPPNAQELQFIRIHNGEPSITKREPCRFVPLISDVSANPA